MILVEMGILANAKKDAVPISCDRDGVEIRA